MRQKQSKPSNKLKLIASYGEKKWPKTVYRIITKENSEKAPKINMHGNIHKKVYICTEKSH